MNQKRHLQHGKQAVASFNDIQVIHESDTDVLDQAVEQDYFVVGFPPIILEDLHPPRELAKKAIVMLFVRYLLRD